MTRRARPDARCRRLLLELSRYLDGELAPAGCRAVTRHLDSCARCATMATRLRKTLSVCRAAGGEPLRGEQRSRARARIKALLAREG